MTAPETGHCPSCGQTFARSSGHCPNDGTRIVALVGPVDDLRGRVLDGRYEVRDAMGAGKIGAMYRGWQISVAREVAIKIVHAGFVGDRAAADRFAGVARLACQLVAPAIGNVYDFGQTSDGVVYVVGELLRGRSLDGEAKRASVTLRRVVGFAMQLTDALDAAHRANAVHGDLKPTNILLDDATGRDVIKVVDFGLARALAPARDPRLGLPLYTAPELLAGAPADVRSDLYSLGCVLYELLTGAPPFVGVSAEAVAGKHRSEPPAALPPNVPAELAAIVKTLLAKSPTERFATCKNLRVRLIGVQSIVGTPPAGVRVSGSISVPPAASGSVPPAVSGSVPPAASGSVPPAASGSVPPAVSGPVPNVPYTRDPTTPPSVPPYVPADRTTPPSMPPYERTTPPSYTPPQNTIPPFTSPPPPPTPTVEPSGSRRIVIIALVAILLSAAGIAAVLTLT